jgi:hypothetical protein
MLGLARNPIATLLVIAAEGLDFQPELLDQRAADETANRVSSARVATTISLNLRCPQSTASLAR